MPPLHICTVMPIQERVDTEKSDRYSNDIKEVRTQEIYSIVGSDILNAEINDGNYLGEKNKPVQYEDVRNHGPRIIWFGNKFKD